CGRVPGVRVPVSREERYWYPDDGGIVWVAGFMPIDPDTRRFLGRDALREQGLIVCGAAGAAQFHDDVFQGDGAEPGEAVLLRRDPTNEHDPNAIAVEVAERAAPAEGDGAEERQLGFIPRELAAELAPRLDANETWSAVVLREQRASPRDPRTGVTLLLAPSGGIELFEPFA
ncbi:MAG: HIRAN domain-containing protein, partial [Actinomycetota bacterium]|nr:HIRAN domain-containing protein [Actinomycetota bacterium]